VIACVGCHGATEAPRQAAPIAAAAPAKDAAAATGSAGCDREGPLAYCLSIKVANLDHDLEESVGSPKLLRERLAAAHVHKCSYHALPPYSGGAVLELDDGGHVVRHLNDNGDHAAATFAGDRITEHQGWDGHGHLFVTNHFTTRSDGGCDIARTEPDSHAVEIASCFADHVERDRQRIDDIVTLDAMGRVAQVEERTSWPSTETITFEYSPHETRVRHRSSSEDRVYTTWTLDDRGLPTRQVLHYGNPDAVTEWTCE
jgi:hypothetical protein